MSLSALDPAFRTARERPSDLGPPRNAWYPVAAAAEARRRVGRTVQLCGSTLGLERVPGASVPQVRDLASGALRPAIEHLGLLWVSADTVAGLPDLVELPGMETPRRIAGVQVAARCDFDQAVLGLVDPAHVPMLHTSWWWRPRSRPRKPKRKAYTPSPFGFTTRAEDATSSAGVYAIGGAPPEVSIEFRLPGVRVEHIKLGGLRLANVTTVTPLSDEVQVLRNIIYADKRWAVVLRPLLEYLGRIFLKQDVQMLERLHCTDSSKSFLFFGDPDLPSLWYFKLKRELARRAHDGEPFNNPTPIQSLRWLT
jgi:phenylpropionate dioxygenase-like ring-hydroxylating dioxygenase large terminal subunit